MRVASCRPHKNSKKGSASLINSFFFSLNKMSTQEGAQLNTTTVAAHGVPSSREEEMEELLDDAVRSLPPNAVKDLLSIGVCSWCILRLLSVQGLVYSSTSLSPSTFSSILGISLGDGEIHCLGNGLSESGESEHDDICIICRGILQFTYCDDSTNLVRRNSSSSMAAFLAEFVTQEGYQIDSFGLEVSIPPTVLENEEAIRLYLEKKYGSEPWFQQCSNFERISTKDALKLSFSDRLDSILHARCGSGPFRIRLTYSCGRASKSLQDSNEGGQGCKRQKIGTENGSDAVSKRVVANYGSSDILNSEVNSVTTPTNNTLNLDSSELLKILPKKVKEPCQLTLSCYRTAIYIGGRYLKYSRSVSQTRWIIDQERMGDASVEEIIGNTILPFCRGDSYKFHAAGREDIDVRMLGSGRPFLVEIQNARRVPSQESIKDIEAQINNADPRLVGVKNLKVLESQGWDLMREGEAEKQKQYTALVWIPRPLEDEDLQTISSIKDLQVLQRTPIRVLHRRSPLDREKIIHWMTLEKVSGSSQYFLLHLCTQAGTYIKEFVHGDLGRTRPSIGSILGCKAEILQLDVTDVKMDCFLDV